jgi:hypothetical protein
LIIADRHLFSQYNLCFLDPKDIPATILAQLANAKIREEMLAAKWGKLVHNFTITHTITVCKEVTFWGKTTSMVEMLVWLQLLESATSLLQRSSLL